MKSRPTILAAIQYFGHSIYSIKTLGVHLVCNDADILRQTTARLPRSPLITGQISLRAVGVQIQEEPSAATAICPLRDFSVGTVAHIVQCLPPSSEYEMVFAPG